MHNFQDLQTVVISLLRSTQRREKVRSELSKTNLAWSFIDAVDGSQFQSVPPEYNPKKVNRLLGFELTPNEIGCFLSHKKAWQTCLESNRPTLIFEDDFVLLPHFENTLQQLLETFHDWRLVRLQGLAESRCEIVETVGDISIVKNKSDPVGATAYIIKPEAAKILIEHSKDIYEPLDHFLEHESKHGVEMLAAKPYPVDISKAKSTISDRPDVRKPIKGLRKKIRSVNRVLDRIISKNPWFPK